MKEHLISDVPLGVWSSGGLDSSTIVHYASSSRPALKTFSVSFAGRSFDESPWFREIAAKYGTDHHEFDLNPEVELARRDRADVVLLRRAELRCGRAAGLVSVEDEPAARHRRAQRRGRGRVVRRLSTRISPMTYAHRLRLIPHAFRRAGLGSRERFCPCRTTRSASSTN